MKRVSSEWRIVMDKIILLPSRPRETAAATGREHPADIIIFPGVRYERRDEDAARTPKGTRPAIDRRSS